MRALLVLLLGGLAQGVLGQARNANWVFADGMWMSFTDSSMAMQPSPYSGPPRSSCISDTAGQFLLLVDNTGVRNALFDLLPGASAAELGWTAPAANFMILPKPGMEGRYLILINEGPPSSRAGYAEVDVHANAGAGAAIGATTWYMDHTTAKLTATTDAAEQGYWIVQHADSGDAFRVFHLTGQGLAPESVNSHAGRAYLADTPNHINADRWGQMKLSTQGDKLAAITNGPNLDTNALELFHFDRANGTLAYWTRIGSRVNRLDSAGLLGISMMSFVFPFMCDMEFDRDGAHLYVVRSDTIPPNLYSFQISLEDPDSAAIALSALPLQGYGSYYNTGYDPQGSLMLLGMNGRLYSRDVMYSAGQNHILEWVNLPTQMSYVSGPDAAPLPDFGWTTHPPYAANIGGFPNLCKRFLDSAPLATGIRAEPPETVLRVRPNPVAGQALLEVSGPVRPTSVRWHDILGHVVHEAPVAFYGPSLVLDRKGLPAGMYIVEPMAKGKSLGFVRVLCE
jgi:hypothetical protein